MPLVMSLLLSAGLLMIAVVVCIVGLLTIAHRRLRCRSVDDHPLSLLSSSVGRNLRPLEFKFLSCSSEHAGTVGVNVILHYH